MSFIGDKVEAFFVETDSLNYAQPIVPTVKSVVSLAINLSSTL